MAEADPRKDILHDTRPGMADSGVSRARRSWKRGAIVGALLLGAATAYSLTDFDEDKWIPEQAPRAPERARVAITPGVPTPGAHLVDYARLDARLNRLVEAKDMVGLGIAVVEKGQISFVKGYGLTEAGGSEKVSTGTVFRWASLSKGVAGTLVAKLAEEGKFSLADPIGKWAPSLKLPNNGENLVSLADLLAHRTGVVHNAYDDKLEGGVDPHVIRTELGALDAYCKPATCHTYQNVAFDAASEAVANATKRSYADMVARKLFVPLGMTSATVTRAGLEGSASWARPHVGHRTLKVEDAYYKVPAAGGVNSSIFDLGLWLQAQMGGDPQVVSPAVLEVIHTPRVSVERRHARSRFDRDVTDQRYSMGWRDMFYDGHHIVGHRGAVAGYRSLVFFDPVTKNGVAVLWNSQSSKPLGVQNEVFDMFYGRPSEDWMELDKKENRGR
uniref:serine hydrolase n=1 Tax=Edaphosphingomonas laterariae TaxID=861865 RepID=UPI000B77EA48|nr:serine hydrolase [Sphingomonas laterariae]